MGKKGDLSDDVEGFSETGELLGYSRASVCKVQALTVVEMYRSLVQNVKAAVGVGMVRSTLLLLEWYLLMCSHQAEECASYVNGICVCELTWRYLIVVLGESWL